MGYIYFLTFTLAILSIASARTKCVKAIGRVQCPSDRAKEADVEVYLMDHDPLNDDTMGFTATNEDGTFKIEGCGYDLWSNPEPYLKIWSYCGTYAGKRIDTPVKQIFVPQLADFGTLSME